MYGVTRLTGDDNIMMISIHDADASLMASTLTDLAQAGVIVDMISQTPPAGTTFTFSFTASNNDFDKTIKTMGSVRQGGAANPPMISSGYAKVNLFGEEMVDSVGVAARALTALCEQSIGIAMITTSDLDISILVRSEDADVAHKLLADTFAL